MWQPSPTSVVLGGMVAALLLIVAALLLGSPPQTWQRMGQWVRGLTQTTGLLAGLTAGAAILVGGAAWGGGLLSWSIALFVVVLLGVYLPGLEARQFRRRQARLTIQAIDLCGYLRLALLYKGEVDALVAYVAEPRPAVRDVQALIAETLDQHRRDGGDLWLTLDTLARSSGSVALMQVTGTLRDVMPRASATIDVALAERRTVLLQETMDRWKGRIPQRELAVTVATAITLVAGLLPFILFVLTQGGLALPLDGLGPR